MLTNIPTVKLGIIAVSRDCFIISLSERRRAAIVAACHNEFLSNLLPILNRAFSEGCELMGRNIRSLSDTVLRDNELLVESFRLRDELSARAAMELHLKHVIHALGMETDP